MESGGAIIAALNLDMNCVWLNNYLDGAGILEVEGNGTAGGSTITLVTGGASYGNSSSGLIWSLLTSANEVVEVSSVSGDTLTLKKPLTFDCLRFRHSYLDDGYNWKRVVRIMPTGISDAFTTDIKADQEGVGLKDFGDIYPTSFFEMDLKVGQTITITGVLVSDSHASSKQYKDALWNLIRGGWVHLLWGVNRNLANWFLIKSVKITRKAIQPYLATGQSTFNTDKYDVQLSLRYAEYEKVKGIEFDPEDTFDQSGEMIGEYE